MTQNVTMRVLVRTGGVLGNITSYVPSSSQSRLSSSTCNYYWNRTTSYSTSTILGSSTKASKKKKDDPAVPVVEEVSYMAQKKANKERRREVWHARQERLERLKNRRKTDRFQDRIAFRSFFIPEKVNNEYMERKARQAGLDWKINVAVILERHNVVLDDLYDWESDFENLRDHLWQFGKEYPKSLNLEARTNNAITIEELMALLPKEFVPAPRETEHDKTGNVKTTERKLKTNIYLAVQEKDGKWQLPTVTIQGEETLLDAAKRALQEQIGSNVEYWCPSNCPLAVKMIPFPEDEQKSSGLYGIKTFFLKVQYDEGTVKELAIDDHAWLDRSEFVSYIKDKNGDEESSKFYYYLL